MKVELHPVGFKGYVFRDDRDLSCRTYEDTTFFVSPWEETTDECYVNFVTGPLDHETNVQIMLKCVEVGYRYGWMAVPHGKPCTRLAKFQYTKRGLDWYRVDFNEVKNGI